MSIVDRQGAVVASYNYDPYGNLISDEPAENTVGHLNPLRYRGYYYDSESRLYYLQSRYYDPELVRFINADSLASTGQGILGNNMFVYCGNNPASRVDDAGDAWEYIIEDAETIVEEESDGKITYVTKITYSSTRKFLWVSFDQSENTAVFRYTISNDGAITFDNTQADAYLLKIKKIRNKLAEEMYNNCTNSVDNSLANRTVEGISSELLWHYRFRITGPGQTANIGGRGSDVPGKDTNAWIFEFIS